MKMAIRWAGVLSVCACAFHEVLSLGGFLSGRNVKGGCVCLWICVEQKVSHRGGGEGSSACGGGGGGDRGAGRRACA